MKHHLPCLLLLLLTAAPVRAIFVESFDTAVANGGAANFANQGAWTIDDPSVDQSFIQPGSSYGAPGNAVGLGGFYSVPVGKTVRLSTVVSEALAGSRFSADFALVNRYDGDAEFFFPDDDRFGFSLSDSSGEFLSIDFNPTSSENIRKVFVNGTGLTPNGILASDYNNQLWYTLTIDFTPNGSDLDYNLSLAGGAITTSGTLFGRAAAVLTGVAIDYDVRAKVAGSNYIVVDNIAVPEPTVSLSALLALATLTLRRRR